MPSIISLVQTLKVDFPQFRFEASDEFRWLPGEMIIYYDQTIDDVTTLLHELSHAVLDHKDYTRDIALLALERDAWQYAKEVLALRYTVAVSEDAVQTSLDTYRDWLHARSTCPQCQAVGVQVKKQLYTCLVCTAQWRVNDARSCALRRYSI